MRRDIGNKVQIVGSPGKSEALNGHTMEGGTAEKRAANGPWEDQELCMKTGPGPTCPGEDSPVQTSTRAGWEGREKRERPRQRFLKHNRYPDSHPPPPNPLSCLKPRIVRKQQPSPQHTAAGELTCFCLRCLRAETRLPSSGNH